MGVFLRAFDRNGAPLGLMPDLTDLQVQTTDNSPGSMTFRYQRDGLNASFIDRDELYLTTCEDGVDSPDWFVLEEDTDDPTSTLTQTKRRWITVAARGYMSVLEQAVVYPRGSNAAGTNLYGLKPEYPFTQATPGTIFKTFTDAAKSRGALNELVVSWNGTVDSAGTPWPSKFDMTYPAGMNYMQVLTNMIEDGWVEARTYGRTLQLFVPNTYFGVKSDVLRYGQNVLAAPRKRSRRAIFSHVLAAGNAEKKSAVQMANTGTASRFGRREGFVSDGNRTTTVSLQWIGQVELNKHQQFKEGFTLEMVMNPPGPGEYWPRPGIDFFCGDRIYYDRVRDAEDRYVPLRVRSITKSWGDTLKAPTCSVELNDLFVKATTRTSQAVAAVTNGSTGVRAPVPRAPGPDTIPPVKPLSVTVTGDLPDLVDEGTRKVYRSRATITWPFVDQDSDGTALQDLDGYEVSVSINGGPWSAGRTTRDTQDTVDGVKPFDLVRARVLAKDTSGNRSEWTYSDSVIMPMDLTPPPLPTPPILTQKLGVVTCRWDGLSLPGPVSMPEDFHHIVVEQSLDPTFAGEVLVADNLFEPNASTVISGIEYGVTWYFRFVAVDVQGNRSMPSEVRYIRLEPLVTGDLPQQILDDIDLAMTNAGEAKDKVNTWTFSGTTQIDGGQLRADTVDGVVVRAHTIGADRLVIGGATNLVPNGTGEWATLGGLFRQGSTFTFDTADKPTGVRGAFRSAAGQGPYDPPEIWWDVEPDGEFLFEVWLKADRAGSKLYMELLDGDGSPAAVCVAITGEPSGAAGSYPVLSLGVPTVWTRYSAAVKPKLGVTRMRVGRIYYNHPDGTQRGAAVSMAVRVRGRGTGRLLVDGSIEGKHIKSNTVQTEHLDVGSVTAEKVALGVLRTNLVADPGFEDSAALTSITAPGQGLTYQWRQDTVGTGATVSRGIGRARSGVRHLVLGVSTAGGAATVARAYSPVFKLETNTDGTDKQYRVNWYALSTGTGAVSGGAQLTVEAVFGPSPDALDLANPVLVSEGPTSPPYSADFDVTTDSYERSSGDILVPSTQTALYCALRFTNTGSPADSWIWVDDTSVVPAGVGGASELTSAGLRLFDDDGDEATALVTNRPNYFTVTKDGVTVGAVNESGDSNFRTVGADEDFQLAGSPVFGRMKEGFGNRSFGAGWEPGRDYDAEPVGVVESMAGGVVAWNQMTPSQTGLLAPGAYQLLSQVNADLESGRLYEVRTSQILAAVPSGAVAALILRFTLNGTDPTPTSPILARYYRTGSGSYESFSVTRPVAGTDFQRDLRVLAQFSYLTGSGTVTPWADSFHMGIFDVGYQPDAGATGRTIATTVQAAAPPPPPPPTTKTYVSTWVANNSQTRRGVSSYGNYTVNPTAYTGSTSMLAGYYSGSNGNQFSFVQCTAANSTGSETGRSISSALSGATVTKVEIYVKNTSFYYNSGGSMRFGMTALGAIPGSSAYAPPSVTYTGNQGFTTGQGRWITLPSAANSVVKNGGRVFIVGPGSSNSQFYYSKWANHAAGSGKPMIRITYSK